MGRSQEEYPEQSEEVSHTLQLRSAVQLDLEDAVIWYEDKQAGLGERFLEQVLEAALFWHATGACPTRARPTQPNGATAVKRKVW